CEVDDASLDLIEAVPAANSTEVIVCPADELTAFLKEHRPDVLVLGGGSHGRAIAALLHHAAAIDQAIDYPVLLISRKDLGQEDEMQITRLIERLPLRDIRSSDRLLDDLALVLHR